MKKTILLLLGVCFLAIQTWAQQLIVIEDLSDVIDEQTTIFLQDDLSDHGLLLVYEVDFRKKCDYIFATIHPKDNGFLLQLRSCSEEMLGSKLLSQASLEQEPRERSQLLASYLSLLSSSSHQPVIARQDSSYLPGASVSVGGARYVDNARPFPALANEHHSRYYFSPSAYNLRKNEFYYNTLNFVIHDIQYGFTDNFSLGLGSSVAFIPVYVTPKISFRLGEKHHLAIGDLFGYGSWGLNNYFNLGYVAYTYGGLTDNITIGAGFVNTDFLEGLNSKPIFSLSATTDFGRRLFFVTEHYFVPRIANISLSKYDSVGVSEFGYPIYGYSEIDYEYSALTVLGFLGVRFVSKKQDTRAFQFGVGYLLNIYEDASAGLNQAPYNEYDYNLYGDEFDSRFFLIPTMNFTYKFGKPID